MSTKSHHYYIDVHTHQNAKPNNDVLAVRNLEACNWQARLKDCSNFSVGLHPWDIVEAEIAGTWECLAAALNCPQCVAIGEIGCDKMCSVPLTLQVSVMNTQLQMANEANRPIILHNVRSTQEILLSIRQARIRVPFIFHGFTGSPQMASQIIRAGGMLSFGKALLQHKSTMEAFETVAPQCVFFETDDDSDLSINAIYQQAAQLSEKPVEDWKKMVEQNFCRTFNIGELL